MSGFLAKLEYKYLRPGAEHVKAAQWFASSRACGYSDPPRVFSPCTRDYSFRVSAPTEDCNKPSLKFALSRDTVIAGFSKLSCRLESGPPRHKSCGVGLFGGANNAN